MKQSKAVQTIKMPSKMPAKPITIKPLLLAVRATLGNRFDFPLAPIPHYIGRPAWKALGERWEEVMEAFFTLEMMHAAAQA